MSEGEALIALIPWIQDQERVTFIYDEFDKTWNIEWFNTKGGYSYVSGDSLQEAVEKIT